MRARPLETPCSYSKHSELPASPSSLHSSRSSCCGRASPSGRVLFCAFARQDVRKQIEQDFFVSYSS